MVLLLLPFATTIVLLTGDTCAFSLGYRYHATVRTAATHGSFQSQRVGLAQPPPPPPLRFDASHQRSQSPYRSTTRQWSPLAAASVTDLKESSSTTTVGRKTVSPSSLRPSTRVVMLASVGDNGTPDSDESSTSNNSASSSAPPPTTWIQRLRRSVSKAYRPKEDGLTFRQRLAKMGLATVLSYGWVSNMSYGVSVSTAWYIFSKRVRTST
jgi:hypothetical protein